LALTASGRDLAQQRTDHLPLLIAGGDFRFDLLERIGAGAESRKATPPAAAPTAERRPARRQRFGLASFLRTRGRLQRDERRDGCDR
jgi:hypothetical protein